MKKAIKVILVILIVLLVIAGTGALYLTRGLDSGKKIPIGKVEPSQLESGVYEGEYRGGRWSNKIKVTVKDQQITRIHVVKTVLFERPEVTRAIIDRVIKNQNTDVDVISGSTVTSKAYLKSIENALSP